MTGIPAGHFTRTIRQDTERLATLYARALGISSPEDAQILVFEEVIQEFPYPVGLTDPEAEA